MVMRLDRLQAEIPPPSTPNPVGLPKEPTGVVADK